jgi:hypothetical protein
MSGVERCCPEANAEVATCFLGGQLRADAYGFSLSSLPSFAEIGVLMQRYATD